MAKLRGGAQEVYKIFTPFTKYLLFSFLQAVPPEPLNLFDISEEISFRCPAWGFDLSAKDLGVGVLD